MNNHLVKRFSLRDQSDKNIRWLDLANMPPPERFAFDAYAAAQKTGVEITRAQLQLEEAAFANLGRYRYALKEIVELRRYAHKTNRGESDWRSYARRVFDAAVAAGNPEACAIAALSGCAKWVEVIEKKRRRSEAAQKRAPEIRKQAAKKAAIMRARNKIERPAARAAIRSADQAFADVFSTADKLTSAE